MPQVRRPVRPPARRPAPPRPAAPPRGFTSNVAGFGRGFASGVKNIATGAVQGAASLAKGGYALATSPQARAQAMQTGRAIANGAKGYAGQVYKDPKRALRDAQAGVNSMYNQFNAARKAAAAKGESAEFWGNVTAEVGSMLVPGGALAKGARGAKVFSVAAEVKNIIKAPTAKAVKSAVSVLPCGKLSPLSKLPPRIASPLGLPHRSVTNSGKAFKSVKEIQSMTRKDALKYLNSVVDDLNVNVARNKAVYWSGGPRAMKTAARYARMRGKSTLEMTPGGKWLNDLKLFKKGGDGSFSQIANNDKIQLWNRISGRFVESTRGEAIAVLNKPKPGSIYLRTERKKMIENGVRLMEKNLRGK